MAAELGACIVHAVCVHGACMTAGVNVGGAQVDLQLDNDANALGN